MIKLVKNRTFELTFDLGLRIVDLNLMGFWVDEVVIALCIQYIVH